MPEREGDQLGKRVKRYARVGRVVGGVAARAVGNKVLGRSNTGPLIEAGDLREALGGLKGPLMKVAQILSTVPDLLPEEFTRELVHLQNNAPSMGWQFVKRRMASELGNDWQTKFESFEREAAAAASLGQVHRALNKDGQNLACKLQYPDMLSVVEADLNQLKLAFGIYRRYDKAIDPRQIHAELSDRLREELDYGREARHMQLYAHMLAGEAGVEVPKPIHEFSTNRLLSMTWLEGRPLMDFVNADLDIRNQLAMNMFRAWYKPFYGFGVIHGDPHLGNYSVDGEHRINLLDFGCVRIFKASFVRAVIDLYCALRDNNQDLAVHAYETWGFENLNNEMIEVLNHWANFLYGPLMEDRTQLISDDGLITYGANIAAKVHGELRRLGGVTPPREFVLMDRAAIGLGSVFTHLKAEINWHREFNDLIQDFEEEKLKAHQKNTLELFDLVPLSH